MAEGLCHYGPSVVSEVLSLSMVEDSLKCFEKFSLYKPGARHCVALHGLPAAG